MKNNIKELKAELLKVFSKFEENDQEPKESEWYFKKNKYTPFKWIFLVDYSDDKIITSKCSFIINDIDNTNKFELGYTLSTEGNERKATDSEVIEAFTNYYRSQGFVSGKTKLKNAFDGREFTYNEPLTFGKHYVNCIYPSSTDGILFDHDTLTIATKIEDEKIMVDGKEVKFYEHCCLINERYFSRYDIQALITLNPIFQKILDKINEKEL
jgi:hypothetical protein